MIKKKKIKCKRNKNDELRKYFSLFFSFIFIFIAHFCNVLIVREYSNSHKVIFISTYFSNSKMLEKWTFINIFLPSCFLFNDAMFQEKKSFLFINEPFFFHFHSDSFLSSWRFFLYMHLLLNKNCFVSSFIIIIIFYFKYNFFYTHTYTMLDSSRDVIYL